jgi:LAS superfamily LD-carboxypeptidase LdcB
MNIKNHAKEIAAGGLVLCLIIFGFVAYKYFNLIQANKVQESNIQNLNRTVTDLESNLFEIKGEKTMLEEAYQNEKTRNDEFEDEIRKISGTVGTLEKLSKTDPELLKKYSKVYFLNEHYIPASLTDIAGEFVYPADKKLQFHGKIYDHLEDLLEDAKDEKINLRIVSAYRSFGTQAALKSSYKVIYGAGTANAFSADQGYSEHQLGTTVDFTTTELAANFNAFAGTEAFKWLLDNAYKYGFILSYPKTNTYYQFEPWHWRYVGLDLARKLHDDNVYFYDTDQRFIDTYLVSIFD